MHPCNSLNSSFSGLPGLASNAKWYLRKSVRMQDSGFPRSREAKSSWWDNYLRSPHRDTNDNDNNTSMPCNLRPDHLWCVVCGALWRATMKTADRSWTMKEQAFVTFGSRDLDIDRMTLIYELDLCPVEIYQMCENELPTSRLSKVIVWQTHRQMSSKLYTKPLHRWSIINGYFWHARHTMTNRHKGACGNQTIQGYCQNKNVLSKCLKQILFDYDSVCTKIQC